MKKPSSGDLEQQKHLFEAPKRPDWLWRLAIDGLRADQREACNYIDWCEERIDDLAASLRHAHQSYEWVKIQRDAYEERIKKMLEEIELANDRGE